MRKILLIKRFLFPLIFLGCLVTTLSLPKNASAQGSCASVSIEAPDQIYEDEEIPFTVKNLTSNPVKVIIVVDPKGWRLSEYICYTLPANGSQDFISTANTSGTLLTGPPTKVYIGVFLDTDANNLYGCQYKPRAEDQKLCTHVANILTETEELKCTLEASDPVVLLGDPASVLLTNETTTSASFYIMRKDNGTILATVGNVGPGQRIEVPINIQELGTHELIARMNYIRSTYSCTTSIQITDDPAVAEADQLALTLLKPEDCPVQQGNTPAGVPITTPGIKTALGCFPTSPTAIIQWILKYAIIFAGGIGFLLMLFASFQMMTSSGDPEKLKSAKGLFSSAIMGILIIVFSLFILKFIGATILKIPGWE